MLSLRQVTGLMFLASAACSSPRSQQPADALVHEDAADSSLDQSPADVMPNPDVPASFRCDPNAPPGPVTVHRTIKNAPVLVTDVNGNFVSSSSSPTSLADLVVQVPGCGSIIATTDSYWFMHTFLASGDEIWPFGGRDLTPSGAGGPLALYIDSPPPGGGGSWVDGPVSGTAGTTSDYLLSAYGTGPATFLVLPASSGYPPARTDSYVLFSDVDFATTSSLHVTTWQSSPPAHQFTITFPDVGTGLSASVSSELRRWKYMPAYTSSTAPSSAPSFSARYPEFGTGTLLIASTVFPNTNTFQISKVLGMPLPSAVTVDLTGETLPRFASLTHDSDHDRPTYSWTFGTSGIEPDALKLEVSGDVRTLRIVLPPGLSSFKLPALPAPYHQTYTQQQFRPTISAFEASDSTGYAQAVSDDRWMWNQHWYPDGSRFQVMIFQGQP